MDRDTQDAIKQALNRIAESGQWSEYTSAASTSLIEGLQQSLGRKHAQLICSGTLGIELALRGLGVGAGDLVMLAAYDYPGNFRAIELTGAQPWLVDLSPNHWSLTLANVAEATKEFSRIPKAIILSHLHGTLAEMDAITDWATQHGVTIVEDACQAHGASIAGRPAGSWGDVSVLSFGGSKLITSGRGGAVLTNDDRIQQRMTVFRERGNDAFAMSELQACVILPQWERLPEQTQRRWEAVQWLEQSLADTKLEMADRESTSFLPAFYKWAFQVPGSDLQEMMTRRDQLIHSLQQKQIRAGAGFLGFHKRSHSRCLRPTDLERSAVGASSTVLIHHSHLTMPRTMLQMLVDTLKEFAGN